MAYQELIRKYPIISDQMSRQSLAVVLEALERQLRLGIEGDIVELGCYVGTTSLFIRRLLDAQTKQNRRFYAYDSFQGLPNKSVEDQSAVGVDFKSGELYTSKKQFIQNFQRAQLRAPVTYKAWFKDLLPEQLPDKIAFAFLDGDFHDSIMDSLKLVWPKLSSHGVVAIDDYDRETLPGVKRAVDTFFKDRSIRLQLEHQIAVIHL